MKVRQHLNIVLALLLLSSLSWWSCRRVDETQQTANHEYSPSLVREWMQFSYDAVKRQGWFALDASRLYAYAAITAYESMVHAVPNGRSMEDQLQGLTNLPDPDPNQRYDWGIVLCHAMPQILEEMMPTMTAQSRSDMTQLAARQESDMISEHNIPQDVLERSKEYANELVLAIIEWSRTDNRLGMENIQYTPPSRVGNPQYWDGSTLGQNFMMPFWWTSRPFVIHSYNICEVAAPIPYSEDPLSSYYQEIKEVYDASFDPNKVAIGQYWANNPGQSGTPAGSWLGIANQLVMQYKLDLATTMKMYVLLTIGTRDGFIACWYVKYKYNLQRPVSYIRNVMGHTSWVSPVPTPPYPDYTSGTSTNAGVSSETLTRLFGVRSFEDAQHTDKGMGVRKFNSFLEAGREAFHSRIYGGVHMRRACQLGFNHGECISEYLWNTLKFTNE
jgi:hypothetical protein